MSQDNSQSAIQGIYDPTTEELSAIGREVFVLKKKPANVVITSYHKWERVWDDNLTLRVLGENTENLYRVLSLSVPLHLGGPGDDRAETIYSGFVVAISKGGNDTRILPMNKVVWTNAPLNEIAGIGGEVHDKRACDPSSTNGCNGP